MIRSNMLVLIYVSHICISAYIYMLIFYCLTASGVNGLRKFFSSSETARTTTTDDERYSEINYKLLNHWRTDSISYLLTYLISTTSNFVLFKLLVWMSIMLRKVIKSRYRLIPEVGYNNHLEMQY